MDSALLRQGTLTTAGPPVQKVRSRLTLAQTSVRAAGPRLTSFEAVRNEQDTRQCAQGGAHALYNSFPVNAASLDINDTVQRLLLRKAPLTDRRLFHRPLPHTLCSIGRRACHVVFMHSSRTAAISANTETVSRHSAESEDSRDTVTPAAAPRRWVRPALFTLLPVALLVGAYEYVIGGATMSTDNAYVDADTVGVSTDVPGVVKEVNVTENQHVPAGEVLYQLGDLQYRLALQRARAQVDTVLNDLRRLQASYRDTQEQVRQAQADLAYYDREFKRQQYLNAQHVSSEQTLEAAHRSRENAQQKLASLTEQLAGIAADLNGDVRAPIENHPRYLEALAQANEAARQLDHTVVRAPFAGIVTNVPSIAPGKYLPASTTAFYLVATDHVWIDANPKETQLTHVRTGQPVEISVDTYPSVKWKGIVESISPAASQQFSLLPAQNTSGNWVKVVQRIPMRIRVDTGDAKSAAAACGNERRSGSRYRAPARHPALRGHELRASSEPVMSSTSEITERQRAAITVSTILATLIYSLDTTIANIALPHIQASVAASHDQITWVLTSYIVASAIMTPATGFLAGRFGLKRIYLFSVSGFVFASMLCGIAQSLTQIVTFRVLQGICGAALVPLSQAVLLSIYPKERQGGAMAPVWRRSHGRSRSRPDSGRLAH